MKFWCILCKKKCSDKRLCMGFWGRCKNKKVSFLSHIFISKTNVWHISLSINPVLVKCKFPHFQDWDSTKKRRYAFFFVKTQSTTCNVFFIMSVSAHYFCNIAVVLFSSTSEIKEEKKKHQDIWVPLSFFTMSFSWCNGWGEFLIWWFGNVTAVCNAVVSKTKTKKKKSTTILSFKANRCLHREDTFFVFLKGLLRFIAK